jgi:hypothetical protein
MKSLQFIVPKQVIKYTSASRVKNTIMVKGTDLLAVTEVYLNNYPIEVWVKMTNTLLIIEVPEFLYNQSITSISLYGRVTDLSNASLSIELSDKSVEGMQKLVQRYVKYLLQTPGTNVFTPGGGGLNAMIGTNTTSEGKNINTRIIDAINSTNTLMFDEQANQLLPLSEKFLNASITSVTASEPDEIILSIKLLNQAGEVSNINLNI